MFKFKQTSKPRLYLFITIYLVYFLGGITYCIIGPDSIINFVNSSDPTVIGLVGGLIFLWPVLLINKLTTFDMTLSFESEKITLEGGSSKTDIWYNDIDMMKLNDRRLNSLDIYDQRGKILYTIQPGNNGDILEEIIKHLSAIINFAINKETRKPVIGSGQYYVITYKRK